MPACARAATDAAGRAEAVDSALDVKLTGEGPLKLSSLVLGVAVDGRFAGRMQFYDEPTAVAYLEIYGVPKGTVGRARTGRVRRRPGGGSRRLRITGEPSDDQHVALGGIPSASLPATLSSGRQPRRGSGSDDRTLRKAER
jgi:hypothetical protein